ncbi:MAG: nucleoside-triphosphatase [Oscillospiraceae bacterium]|nr:nucleoside-triphosphatase [Oscillospiraceae bacterium]
MHIFLQGPKNTGKSTVIRKTLDILTEHSPITLGGFFTWSSGGSEPDIFMRPAERDRGKEVYRIAGYSAESGGLDCDIDVFENIGTRLLTECAGAQLLIMDELGKLESGAPVFRRAVLNALSGDIPILGVLRLGDVPWLAEIRDDSRVTLIDVNKKNRDSLPREIAGTPAFALWVSGVN